MDMQLAALFTTNFKEKILAGDVQAEGGSTVIEVGPMDRPGVEKLARLVVQR